MKTKLSASLALFFLTISLFGQSDSFVKDGGMSSPLHESHVGKIGFMDHYISLSDNVAADLLSSFELTKKSNLCMRAFLKKSLTNYMHELAPDLSAEELVAKGNYQFTFYVDGKHIYTEELNVGAGSLKTKNEYTALWIPLASTEKEDSWGRYLWMRFMARGGQLALGGGTHQLNIEIRPYVQLDELKVGEVMANGEIEIVVPKKKLKEKDLAVQAIASQADWKLSQDKIDESVIREMNRKIADETFKDITSIVVIKDGALLLEEYFNKAKRKTLHDTRSVGKSVAGTLIGAAIEKGHLKSEHQKLGDFYPLSDFQNYDTKKEDITLEHLLCMASGIGGSDFDMESASNEENMYPTSDWVKFALDLPMNDAKEPGNTWDYFTAGAVLLGDIVHRSVPSGIENFANTALFQPLGIRKVKWPTMPNGQAHTAGGLRLNALDLAKFGQLYKDGGQWNGKQIISTDWVDKSLYNHHTLPMGEDNNYGYLFWSKVFEFNGERHEAFYASGNGGNQVLIFTELPLVIVITATAYNTPYGRTQADSIVKDFLLPAIFNN